MNGRLTPNRRRFFRNELRYARAATFRDSENFSEILFVLERFGLAKRGRTDFSLKIRFDPLF